MRHPLAVDLPAARPATPTPKKIGALAGLIVLTVCSAREIGTAGVGGRGGGSALFILYYYSLPSSTAPSAQGRREEERGGGLSNNNKAGVPTLDVGSACRGSSRMKKSGP